VRRSGVCETERDRANWRARGQLAGDPAFVWELNTVPEFGRYVGVGASQIADNRRQAARARQGLRSRALRAVVGGENLRQTGGVNKQVGVSPKPTGRKSRRG
jgi:hypothetical protein